MRIRFEPRADGAPDAGRVEELLLSEHRLPDPSLTGAEGVLEAFVGSRAVRQGPAPSAEARAAMLDVISRCMDAGEAIPVLVPSGPKKNGIGRRADLAELSALRMMGALQRAVSRIHEPGLDFAVRLEDATGRWLEGRLPRVADAMELYISGVEALVGVLQPDLRSISLVRETAIVDSEVFEERCAEFFPVFFAAVLSGDGRRLAALGWRGGLQREMLEFLDGRYRRIYPEEGADFRAEMTARYLSGTLARISLGATGARKDWQHGHLEIGFAPPMPGSPAGTRPTRVHWRTVPADHSKAHVPFWRATGVLKMRKGRLRYGLVPTARTSEGLGEGLARLENESCEAVISCGFEKGEVR